MATKCKASTAITNKCICAYIKHVYICAKFKLATTKPVACMTTYRHAHTHIDESLQF